MGLENCQEAVPARAGIARFGSAPGNPSQTETLCYYPNAKVVSIIALRDKTSSASKEKDLKILWDSQIERTIAVGPLHIYKPPASIAFLSCGAALQPLFPRSQCWCLDKSGRQYILQIRPPHYWRIELDVCDWANEDTSMSFRKSISSVLQLEKTSFPFQSTRNSPIRSYPSAPNLTTALADGGGISTSTSPNDNSPAEPSATRALGSRAQERRSLPPISDGNAPELLLQQQPQPVSVAQEPSQPPNTSRKRSLPPASEIKKRRSKPTTVPARIPCASIGQTAKTVTGSIAETSAVHVAGYIHPGKSETYQQSHTTSGRDALESGTDTAEVEKGTETDVITKTSELAKEASNGARAMPVVPSEPDTSHKSGALNVTDDGRGDSLIQSICQTVRNWPGHLISLFIRIVKSCVTFVWAADPSTCTAATAGASYDWDSDGELSGFSDDELIVSSIRERVCRRRADAEA